MKLKFSGILPYFIRYKEIEKPTVGKAWLIFITISPSHKNDKGLLAHEIEHVKQFYRLPLIHGLLYRFNKKYRLYAEVGAYKVQLKYSNTPDLFAKFISERYDLNISKKEVLILLLEE